MDENYKFIGDADDLVIEECSELIHAICKIKRFGLQGADPKIPNICNAQLALNEISDLYQRIEEFKPTLESAARAFMKYYE